MTFMHVQATLAHTSGDPELAIVNNWYCSTTDSSGGSYTGAISFVSAGLTSAYNQFGAAIPNAWKGTTSAFKIYDLALPKPNPPVAVVALTLPATTGLYMLPPELALVGSFYSDAPSGTHPARRRGRCYFGPWSYSAIGDLSVPPTTLRTAVNAGLNALLSASTSASSWKWSTFSRVDAGGWLLPGGTEPPNLSAGMKTVIGGWVDDAWDIQRRRGLHSTNRSTFGVPQRGGLLTSLPAAESNEAIF